jgi:hypothetical protein
LAAQSEADLQRLLALLDEVAKIVKPRWKETREKRRERIRQRNK